MRSEVTILSLPFLLLLPPNSYDCLLIIARISYTRRIFRFRKFRSLTFEFSRGTRGHLVASVASNDVRLRIGVVGINSNARRIRPAVRRDLFCRYSDARRGHQWSIPHRGCVGEFSPTCPSSRPCTFARTMAAIFFAARATRTSVRRTLVSFSHLSSLYFRCTLRSRQEEGGSWPRPSPSSSHRLLSRERRQRHSVRNDTSAAE